MLERTCSIPLLSMREAARAIPAATNGTTRIPRKQLLITAISRFDRWSFERYRDFSPITLVQRSSATKAGVELPPDLEDLLVPRLPCVGEHWLLRSRPPLQRYSIVAEDGSRKLRSKHHRESFAVLCSKPWRIGTNGYRVARWGR